MNATKTAAVISVNDRVLIDDGRNYAGDIVPSPARRKTGVRVARVTAVSSRLIPAVSGYRSRATRVYDILTTEGHVVIAASHTFWLAPEDSAAVKRAHAEALAEDAERTAAAPAVEPVAVEVPAAAPAAERTEGDELDGLKFGQLMELAKALKVPGRGTARIDALREGIRAARAAA